MASSSSESILHYTFYIIHSVFRALTKLLHISTLSPVLSLILPTYNEAQNLPSLIDLIDGVLAGGAHEIIIVDDDSPDGTWRVAQSLAARFSSVRVLRRIGKKGLSSAVIDGFDAAMGDVLMVMDADGQHDALLLLKLQEAIATGSDIAIGSRYVSGGSVGEWVTDRRIISKAGTFFASRLSSVAVSDPLGGFFALRTSVYKQIRHKLHPTGFKILLEILANVPPESRLMEVPLIFRMRLHGESKLSFRVQMQFIGQVLRLGFRKIFGAVSAAAFLVFWLLALLIASMLLSRIFSLAPMYLSGALRSDMSAALRQIANNQGWLLSDMELTWVSDDHIKIAHRDHIRLPNKTDYCTIWLHPVTLTCDAL